MRYIDIKDEDERIERDRAARWLRKHDRDQAPRSIRDEPRCNSRSGGYARGTLDLERKPLMSKFDLRQRIPHVPPTPDEFQEIMAGRMSISRELIAFWRDRSDEELATWFRDRTQWSYVLRAPDGDVVAHRTAKERKECEEWAIRHAEEHVEENAMVVISEGVTLPPLEVRLSGDWSLDHHWNWHLLGDWHFVLWPPAC